MGPVPVSVEKSSPASLALSPVSGFAFPAAARVSVGGSLIQTVFSSSYRNMLSARPLRSTGVTPLLRYYGPLRLPAGPPRRLCLPAARWSLSLPPDRASQAPRLIFPRALSPTTPEGPLVALACCFTTGFWLHLSRQTGHLRIPIEAESGSLALRLTGSPPEPHWPHHWSPRSFGYMLNRQFTW